MVNGTQEIGEDLLIKISKIVDVPFAQRILQNLENDSDLRVHDVSIRMATNKGDNYASDIFRAFVRYTRPNGNGSVNENKSLIIKVEPLTIGVHQEMISKSSLFPTEISMMNDTLPRMNELLGPNCAPLNGRVFYAQSKNPLLLVIEDLAPLGFRLADRRGGLDMDHCLLIVRNLARFHASSVALLERDPSLKSRYTCGLFNRRQASELKVFYERGFRQLSQEIADWPELDSNLSEKILKLADTIYERGCDASDYRDDEFIVLNHGDCWVNNMLFKYNECNRPIQHMFVDFQLCRYTSPAFDLNYFFNTSMIDDTLVLYEDMLIHEYARTLALTMTEFKCTTVPPSPEGVKNMIREHAVVGLITSVAELPFMLASKDEAQNPDDVFGGKTDNPVYKQPLYRQAMIRRLPMFDQMGLLD